MERAKLAAGLKELRATLLSTCALVSGGWNELALQEAIDILSSPCACRGETPIAEWDGWYPTYGSPDDQPARYIVLPREKP